MICSFSSWNSFPPTHPLPFAEEVTHVAHETSLCFIVPVGIFLLSMTSTVNLKKIVIVFYMELSMTTSLQTQDISVFMVA